MNTAARAFDHGSWFQGSLKKIPLSRESWGMLILIAMMLVSAVSVV